MDDLLYFNAPASLPPADDPAHVLVVRSWSEDDGAQYELRCPRGLHEEDEFCGVAEHIEDIGLVEALYGVWNEVAEEVVVGTYYVRDRYGYTPATPNGPAEYDAWLDVERARVRVRPAKVEMYFVRSEDGVDYRAGLYHNGEWRFATRQETVRERQLLKEPGAYVWGRSVSQV